MNSIFDKSSRFTIFLICVYTILIGQVIFGQQTDYQSARHIFNGKHLEGWNHKGNWAVIDGVIARVKSGGALMYRKEKVPDNFELSFDWKVGPLSNSGVYYRPGQYEYQILDNAAHNGKNPRSSAACIFACPPRMMQPGPLVNGMKERSSVRAREFSIG